MKKRFISLLLSFFIVTLFASCEESSNESADISSQEESKVTVSDEPIGYESAELSADLFDFTLKIDESTYKLPTKQSVFNANGFVTSTDGTTAVKSSFKADGTLSKGDTSFNIQVINPTRKDLPFESCPIGRISYDFSGTAEIYISDSFLLNNATKKSITEKYGEPNSSESHSDFSEITYGSRSTTGNYALYLFRFNKNGKITYFSIVNHYIPT